MNELTDPVPDIADADDAGALLSRLRLIQEQPLETRAEALGHVHDELRAILEAGDAPPAA